MADHDILDDDSLVDLDDNLHLLVQDSEDDEDNGVADEDDEAEFGPDPYSMGFAAGVGTGAGQAGKRDGGGFQTVQI